VRSLDSRGCGGVRGGDGRRVGDDMRASAVSLSGRGGGCWASWAGAELGRGCEARLLRSCCWARGWAAWPDGLDREKGRIDRNRV
jgi:hypothetical protein